MVKIRILDGEKRAFCRVKPTLLERFEQIEIYIASYPIDIVEHWRSPQLRTWAGEYFGFI